MSAKHIALTAGNLNVWGAHAWSVLVFAFCEDELFLTRESRVAWSSVGSSFRRNAETSTLQACAPQKLLRRDWHIT